MHKKSNRCAKIPNHKQKKHIFFTIFTAMEAQQANSKNIKELLQAIAGHSLPNNFGIPFTTTFPQFHNAESEEQLQAAGYICSLFLSCILTGFPSEKLNIFTHQAQEHCTRFTFNCNMYETIYNQMEKAELESVPLLDSQGHCTPRRCSKEDIFEAFDFYTNR